MTYIIAGEHRQADNKRRELGLSPHDCIMLTSAQSCVRLRGRQWHDGDQLVYAGTWRETDYDTIHQALRIAGIPFELLK